MSQQHTLEDLLNDAPEYAGATSSLYSWSTNFEAGTGPFSLFLDLIGWSADELGEPIYSLADANLGYVELDKLADALKEYASRPTDVGEYVSALVSAETDE